MSTSLKIVHLTQLSLAHTVFTACFQLVIRNLRRIINFCIMGVARTPVDY